MPIVEKRKQIAYSEVDLSLGTFKWYKTPSPYMVHITEVTLKENPKATLIPFITQMEKILTRSGYNQFLMHWTNKVNPEPLLKERDWIFLHKTAHEFPQYHMFKNRSKETVKESFGTLLETDLDYSMKEVLSGRSIQKSDKRNPSFDEELEVNRNNLNIDFEPVPGDWIIQDEVQINDDDLEELLAREVFNPRPIVAPVRRNPPVFTRDDITGT